MTSCSLLLAGWFSSATAQQLTITAHDSISFDIFQFPRDHIPRIDGKTDDWAMVPDRYTYGSELLNDTEDGQGVPDPADLDERVKVGWVQGLSRLNF